MRQLCAVVALWMGAALPVYADGPAADAPGAAAGTAGAGEIAGDREYGAYLAGECQTCHRGTQTGTQGIPVIRGMSAGEFVAALREYRDGSRTNEIMIAVARRLGDEEIAALAAYYSDTGNGTR